MRYTKVHSEYVRVKFNGFNRAVWAIKRKLSNGLVMYTKCTCAGDICPSTKVNIFIAGDGDVAWEKPAVMNLKYAELEIL